MIAVFFVKSGQVASVSLQKRKIVNAEWYSICLPEVFEALECTPSPNNGICGLLLHHDKVSAHIATATLNYLETNRFQGHPSSVPSSEGAAEGEAAPRRPRCSSLFRGRDLILSCLNQRGPAPWSRDLTGGPSASMLRGVTKKNWTRQKIRTCFKISTARDLRVDSRVLIKC